MMTAEEAVQKCYAIAAGNTSDNVKFGICHGIIKAFPEYFTEYACAPYTTIPTKEKKI